MTTLTVIGALAVLALFIRSIRLRKIILIFDHAAPLQIDGKKEDKLHR